MDTKWWFRSLNASLHLSFYSRENWDRKRFYLRSCNKEVVPGLRYCDPEVTVIQAQVTYWFRVCPSTHLVRGEISPGKQTSVWPGISVRCDCFIRTAMPVALNVVCILRDVPPGSLWSIYYYLVILWLRGKILARVCLGILERLQGNSFGEATRKVCVLSLVPRNPACVVGGVQSIKSKQSRAQCEETHSELVLAFSVQTSHPRSAPWHSNENASKSDVFQIEQRWFVSLRLMGRWVQGEDSVAGLKNSSKQTSRRTAGSRPASCSSSCTIGFQKQKNPSIESSNESR